MGGVCPHPHLPPRLFRTYVIVIHDFSQSDRVHSKKSPFQTLPSTKILEVFLGFHPCRYHQTTPPKRNINLSQKTNNFGCLPSDFLFIFFLNPCTPNQPIQPTHLPGFERKISPSHPGVPWSFKTSRCIRWSHLLSSRCFFLVFFGVSGVEIFARLFEVLFFFGGESAESESPTVKLQ